MLLSLPSAGLLAANAAKPPLQPPRFRAPPWVPCCGVGAGARSRGPPFACPTPPRTSTAWHPHTTLPGGGTGRLDEALADENNRGGGTPRAKIPVRKGMQLPSASGRRSASPAQLGKSAGEVEEKYKELLRRQKKLLEAERKHLVKMRAAYTNEVRGRTEIEKFLRKVLEDVRQDVMARRNLADADIR